MPRGTTKYIFSPYKFRFHVPFRFFYSFIICKNIELADNHNGAVLIFSGAIRMRPSCTKFDFAGANFPQISRRQNFGTFLIPSGYILTHVQEHKNTQY